MSQWDPSAIKLSEPSQSSLIDSSRAKVKSGEARKVEEQKSTRRGSALSTLLQRPTMQNQAIVVNGK